MSLATMRVCSDTFVVAGIFVCGWSVIDVYRRNPRTFRTCQVGTGQMEGRAAGEVRSIQLTPNIVGHLLSLAIRSDAITIGTYATIKVKE